MSVTVIGRYLQQELLCDFIGARVTGIAETSWSMAALTTEREAKFQLEINKRNHIIFPSKFTELLNSVWLSESSG